MIDLSPEALKELKGDWLGWCPVSNNVAYGIARELYNAGLIQIAAESYRGRKIYKKTKAGLAYSELAKS